MGKAGADICVVLVRDVLFRREVGCSADLRSKCEACSCLPVRLCPPRRSFLSLQLGLQTVPKILHFPPALAEGDGGRYAIDQSQHMHMAGQVKAEDMARFVKEKTGVSFPIVRYSSRKLVYCVDSCLLALAFVGA